MNRGLVNSNMDLHCQADPFRSFQRHKAAAPTKAMARQHQKQKRLTCTIPLTASANSSVTRTRHSSIYLD